MFGAIAGARSAGKRVLLCVALLSTGKKENSMNESRVLRKEIEKYLKVPFVLAIPLLIMNGVVYCMDTGSGVVISAFIVIYLSNGLTLCPT
jgi:hypothetical protein